jgi:hypothetical protein
MKKKQKVLYYFLIFIIASTLINTFYRPYIYSNNIYDYGFADIGNNLFFIPGIYFMTLVLWKKPIFGYIKDIYFHLFILIFLEILSNYIRFIGTFDIRDILALFAGAGLTFFITLKLNLSNTWT